MSDEPIWITRARREVGVKERPGTAENPRILEYHATTRLRAKRDEVPWCSAFVCWVFEGLGIASTRSAAARSWATWGRALAKPEPGCVVVLDRQAPDNPNAAHVGFYLGDDGPDRILVLGGNQGNAVSVRPYPRAKVLGWRWPEVS